MNCGAPVRTITLIAIIFFLFHTGGASAQATFELELQKRTDSLLSEKGMEDRKELFPNPVLQNLMSPSGWGGFGTYIFGGIGGDHPQPYTKAKPDLISFAGFCIGDPRKLVNIAISINATNVSELRNFSGNFAISRQIFSGSSISAGALQLFARKKISDAPEPTFYIAFSHAIQGLPSRTEGSARISYTIGIGNGRFYEKSILDIRAGRGRHGTAVFGSISYELLKWLNLNAEWSGLNLGCSLGIKPFDNPLAVGFGVTNLTRYASDRPNATFVICYPLSLRRKL